LRARSHTAHLPLFLGHNNRNNRRTMLHQAICSFLPIASRTHARLVCTAWRRLAGEAVTVVGFSAGQLKSQVCMSAAAGVV
jgi:hypothetical protein